MLVHSRRRRPAPIQYWTVFHVGVSISSEHTLTQIQRRLNAGPASPALAIIHTTLDNCMLAELK